MRQGLSRLPCSGGAQRQCRPAASALSWCQVTPNCPCSLVKCHLPAGATYDLRREAAHNLALIYRQSGADPLARQLLRQHLTV